MNGDPMDRWQPVPKIAVALFTAFALIAVAAAASIAGLDLVTDTTSAISVIVLALGPVVVGYLKSDE